MRFCNLLWIFTLQDIQKPDLEWSAAADHGKDVDGVTKVPEFESSLNEHQMSELQIIIDERVRTTDMKTLDLICSEYITIARVWGVKIPTVYSIKTECLTWT